MELMERKRPNYFVAVQISDPEIHAALQCVQNHIVEQDEHLEECMTSLATLHITLMVLNISDDEALKKSLEAIKNVFDEWNDIVRQNPITLEFQGISNFRNTVVFAKLMEGEALNSLHELAESTKQHFAEKSIFPTDRRSSFTPHLTIAKIKFDTGLKRKIRKINPSFYEMFENNYFGKQIVEGIQLLSMEDEKTESGYYKGSEFLFDLPTRKVVDNSSFDVATEKRKEEVRQKTFQLVQEALEKQKRSS